MNDIRMTAVVTKLLIEEVFPELKWMRVYTNRPGFGLYATISPSQATAIITHLKQHGFRGDIDACIHGKVCVATETNPVAAGELCLNEDATDAELADKAFIDLTVHEDPSIRIDET